MGAHLRIEADGPTGRSVKGIWLDGQDISGYTAEVQINISPQDVTKAELTVFVDKLDLDFNADVQITTPLLRREKVDA